MNSLFSNVTIQAFKALARDPNRTLYQRETAKEAGISVGSANGALRTLTELGLVEEEKRGKITLYRFNLHNPAARQLKTLLSILELRRFIEDLKPHTTLVILFGSTARGEDTPQSDIDLYIGTTQKTIVSEIINRYVGDRRLSAIVHDVEEEAQLRENNPTLWGEIERGVILVEA